MRLRALATSVLIGLSIVVPASAAQADPAPLTNLAHLNFLGDTVSPPAQAGHTTYRLDREPSVGVLWTYADRREDGHYDRIGGGAYDPATNTYSQGAFNSDDLARAAVVYLRHWRQTRDPASRDHAYGLLRGLTYLQTTSGPNAGNVVLWMQPDGTLNPSAEPVELPDPSDSGPSYWLARSVWALGEGYAAFRGTDFGDFLRTRLDLAIAALDRQVLSKYGTWQTVDGVRVPAWLVVDGADASAEAVLGLAAYVSAGGGRAARTALARLAEGVAALGSEGQAGSWPYGAVLPWALSRSDWHGWASQMPAALARASAVLHRPDLGRPAVADSATFSPYLLTAGGPDNGWLPTPIDRTQIAYGVDSRVQSLLATAELTGSSGLRELAGVTAGWFFGANASGQPAYDPATGRTVDGVSGDGVVNRNGGAESTIHGLLTMLALDASPPLARAARAASGAGHREATTLVEGESATGGEVVTPESAWTGESQWSGGTYVRLADDRAEWTVPPSGQPRLVAPVVDKVPGYGRTAWSAGGTRLGTVDSAGAPQGASPAPGALLPVTLRTTLPAGATSLTATATGTSTVDAVLLRPEVTQVVYGHTALLQSAAAGPRTRTVTLPVAAKVTILGYDGRGTLVDQRTVTGTTVPARVAAGGFTVLRW
jgi:hypothetical protein